MAPVESWLLTIRQASTKLGLPEDVVSRMISADILPTTRVSSHFNARRQIVRAGLERWLSTARAETRKTPLPVTSEELLARLQNVEGQLLVLWPTPAERRAWVDAADRARQRGRVPAGMVLRCSGRPGKALAVSLFAPPPPTVPPPEVKIPTLDEARPVIAKSRSALKRRVQYGSRFPDERSTAGRRGTFTISVSPEMIDRALTVAHAIVAACEERGWKVRAVKDGNVCIQLDGYSYTIEIREGTRRVPTTSPGYGKYDFVPSGRLEVLLPNRLGPRSAWRDTERLLVEDKLGSLMEVLAQLPDASRAAERHQAERAEELRREREEMERQRQLREKHQRYVTALDERVDAWEKAERIRRWVTAAEERLGDSDRPDVREWLAWARTHADRMDSLTDLQGAPSEPIIGEFLRIFSRQI